MKKEILKAYKEFRRYGIGGIVGQDAANCLAYARVEYLADKLDIVPQWEYDCDDDPNDWMDDVEITEWRKSDHTCEYCSIVTDDGECGASLGGIWDADDKYRRSVECELLLEVIPVNDYGMRALTGYYS